MFRRLVIVGFLALLLALLLAPASAQDTLPATLNVSGGPGGVGLYLVAQNGMTVYSFKRDGLGVSNCVDNCAAAWPPYTVESADGLTLGEGIPGEIGTITRADGTLQVTYNDMPLYFWQNDAAPGDVNGHNFRTVWLVVPPAHVYAQNTADHGIVLVGANGFTLYTLSTDTPNTSTCYDQCAVAWPPVTVEDPNALVTAINLPGIFSTFERTDGKIQVAYNGQPLYYWQNDAARGDTTGHLVNDVWFVAKP